MTAELETILERHRRDPLQLLQILIELQARDGWLPPATLSALAGALGIPRARVESTASFYSFLHTRPAGEYRILFSDNITDRMLGNQALFERMLENFGLAAGEVSADGLVSVDLTSCTGMCDQGPAILVNEIAITRMTAQRVDEICALAETVQSLDEACYHLKNRMRNLALRANLLPWIEALEDWVWLGKRALLVLDRLETGLPYRQPLSQMESSLKDIERQTKRIAGPGLLAMAGYAREQVRHVETENATQTA